MRKIQNVLLIDVNAYHLMIVIGLYKKIVKTYLKIKIFIIILLIQTLLLLLLQDMESINERNIVYHLNLQQMECLQNHGEE